MANIDEILRKRREAQAQRIRQDSNSAYNRFQQSILTGGAAQSIIDDPSRAYDVINVASGQNLGGVAPTGVATGGIAGDLLMGLLSPATSFATGLGEQSRAAAMGGADYKPAYMSEEEWEQYKANPLGKNIQNIAGLASYAVPGIGAGIPGLIAGGAAAGALGSFAQQDLQQGLDMGNILGGAAMGGAIGGIGGGIGKLLGGKVQPGAQTAVRELGEAAPTGVLGKLGGKVEQYAMQRNTNAIKRLIGGGVPARKLGGAQLLDDVANLSGKYGTAINSADDLLNLSQQMLNDYGSAVGNRVKELAQQGQRIAADDILKPLQAKLKGALASDKAGIQSVINDIEQHVAQFGDDASSMYVLKQQLGPKGKWSPITDPNLRPATEAYEAAYKTINQKLENIIGPEFREANKMVENAIKFKQHAEKGNLSSAARATFNDPLADMTMFGALTGGPVGGIAGLAAGKVTQSPQFERALGGVAGGAAKVLKGEGIPRLGMQNAISGMSQKLGSSPVARGIGQVAQNPQVQRALTQVSRAGGAMAPALAGTGQPGVPGSEIAGAPLGAQPPGQMGTQTQLGSQAGGGMQLDPQTAFWSLVQQGMEPTEAIKQVQALQMGVSGQFDGSGGLDMSDMSITERKTVGQAQAGTEALGRISQLLSGQGAFGGTQLGMLLPDIIRPGESKQLATEIDRAAEMFGRMQSGGAINKDEEDRFRRLLPSLSDDPATKQQKLQAIADQFQFVLGGDLGGQAQLGSMVQSI